MTWTIYSIGDAQFLEQILIAVAMFSGSGDFIRAVSIGMLIGVLLLFFKSLQEDGRVSFGPILVTTILYSIAFGSTTTVLIEDVYTGEVRPVDNVPLGPAAVGGTLSNIGYGMMRIFELAYTVTSPNVTENKFADSLQLINGVRGAAASPTVLAAMDLAHGGAGANIAQSIENYLMECTLTKIDLGEATAVGMFTKPFSEAMRFDSGLYHTRLLLGGEPQNYTCSEAYALLTDVLNQIKINPVFVDAVGNSLAGPGNPDNPLAVDFKVRLDDALRNVADASVQSQDYMLTAVLRPIYEAAAIGQYQNYQDISSAIMVNQGIQQRNTQWAAEQSMFMTTVRPLMTFFEGFVYAITPLAAFFMVMGGFGLGLIGKYLITLVWIQLWMPVLSIINMYIYMAASGTLAKVEEPFTTFYGIDQAHEITAHWIATGGMLAASTPLIALFIVTGSTYTLNSLAGRISGGDHINEKIASPDVVAPAAAMNMLPKATFDEVRGLQFTGAESMVDKVSAGSMLTSAVSSSEAASAQANKTFATSLSNSVFSGQSVDQSYARLQSLGESLRSSDSAQIQAINNRAQDYGREHGLSASQTSAVAGSLALAASAQVSPEKLGGVLGKAAGALSPVNITGAATGTATSQSSDQRQQMTRDIDKMARSLGLSESDSAALTSDLASQVNSESGERFNRSLGEEEREQLSETATQAVSATETYQRLQGLQQTIGTTSAMDLTALAGVVAGNSQAHGYLRDGMRLAPQDLRQLASERAQFYEDTTGMDPARATAAGQLYAMLNSGNASSAGMAAEAIAMAIGGTGHAARFDEQAHLAGHAPEVTYGQGAPGLTGPARMTDEQRSQALQEVDGRDAVLTHHANREERVLDRDAENRADHVAARLGPLRAQIMSSDVTPGVAASILGSVEGIGRFAEQTIGGSGAAGQAFSQDFANSMRELASMSVEDRERFLDGLESGDRTIKEEFGLAGQVAVGAADLGRAIMGAGVSGYQAGKEWLTGSSDLSEAAQGMSIRERGAFYAAALASAGEAGADHAERFVQEYDHEFREVAAQTAIHEYGLQSEAGAQLFASSLLGSSDGREAEYRAQLAEELGGDTALADKSASLIEAAARAGREQAGGYLMPVSRYLSVSTGTTEQPAMTDTQPVEQPQQPLNQPPSSL